MFYRWCGILQLMSCSKPSPYFFVPIILVKVDLSFICPKNTNSSKVFLNWLDVVKGGFCLPWKGSCNHPPLLSSVDIQAFLCCWAHQYVLFLSHCTKQLIWPLLMFLLSLWWIFCFCSIRMAYFPCIEVLWPHVVCSQQLLPNANSTLGINSRSFTCFIDKEITN